MVPSTPEPRITAIALILNFLRATMPPTNNNASMTWKFDRTISAFCAWNKARLKMDNPAPLINATTAGRRLANNV